MKYDADEFSTRLLTARQLGKEALQELAEDHLPLVAAMVHRFPPCQHEREELYQQGCIGLMKALARYDPAYGTSFSTYAAPLILGEMRALCRLDAPIHIPRTDKALQRRIAHARDHLTLALGREPTMQELAAVMRMDAHELILVMEQVQVTSCNASSGRTLIDLIPDHDNWMERLMLRDLLSRLSQQDQRLILLRLHMGRTQTETARSLGLSQVQVSRREMAIKRELRQAWLAAE